ncbi:MAG TPA: hypothetical protein ENJ95_14290 [Bacteroidetes bacterium]|nr:hypothetical protein [Bacteroidota bacterium]
MKNLLLGLVTILMFSINLAAQKSSKPARLFQKGQTDVQIGYGLLTTAVIVDHANAKMPPLTVKVDRMFSDNFSLGLSYTHSIHEAEPIIVPDGIFQRVTNNTRQIALRPTFHFTHLKNLDFYGGALLGVNIQKFSVDQGGFDYIQRHMGIKPKRNTFAYSAFIGGRYAINKRWTAFGEIGFSAALLSVGIGYKI